MFLVILEWIGKIVGSVLLIFVIATSLYYISELLEERSVLSKRYITRYIQFVIAYHIMLWVFDGLPFLQTVWSILTNVVYLTVMRSFPVISLTSSSFIAACIGAISTHFFWFRYFTGSDLPPHTIYNSVPNFEGETLRSFSQVASFFGLLVWAVPLLLFLCLSANDNVLPTHSENAVQGSRKGLAKQSLESLYNWLNDALAAFGFKEKKHSELLM